MFPYFKVFIDNQSFMNILWYTDEQKHGFRRNEQIGEGLVTTNRYANLGATFWIAPNVSLGARLAYWSTKQEGSALTNEISALTALRFIMN
jgi:hypothetical protein